MGARSAGPRQRRANGCAAIVEGDEADAAFDDERVLSCRDDVAEPHAADGVGRQPRVHPDLDRHALQRQLPAERSIGRRDKAKIMAKAAKHWATHLDIGALKRIWP